MTDKERLYELRKRVFRAIKEQLEEDPMCKSYEGAIEVGCEYPNFFEDDEYEIGDALPAAYYIRLHCYVLGPSRHYDFVGKTFRQALDEFEKALDEWGVA